MDTNPKGRYISQRRKEMEEEKRFGLDSDDESSSDSEPILKRAKVEEVEEVEEVEQDES